jgi:hypothetical protein
MKPYANDGWDILVRSIRGLWYEAAQKTGSVESAAKLLLDMMAPGKWFDGDGSTNQR